MYFNSDQTAQINDLIGNIERRTGIELVAAVVGKCDSYPEIPWKAFALSAAFGALVLLAQAIVQPGRAAEWDLQRAPVFILGIGAAVALLSIFWPACGRLFLDRARAETEIEQHARAFFLERELFRTRNRTAMLLLVSLFERNVVIVPDSGVAARLDRNALQAVIHQMTPDLRRKDRFQAVLRGLTALEAELVRAGFGPIPKTDNELADGLIQQKGEDR